MSSSQAKPDNASNLEVRAQAHWRANLGIVAFILLVWFSVSFGAGILAKDWLDQYSIGGAPLGFWMAQQGSIIAFLLLLVCYMTLSNRNDKKYGFDSDQACDSASEGQ